MDKKFQNNLGILKHSKGSLEILKQIKMQWYIPKDILKPVRRRVLATINCTQKEEKTKHIVWLGTSRRKRKNKVNSNLAEGRTQAETGNGEGED